MGAGGLAAAIGLRGPDPAGTFRSDVITVLAALPFPAVQTATTLPTAAATGATRVASGPGCPALDPVCGLAIDTDVLIADGEGAFDLFTVSDVTLPAVSFSHNTTDWAKVYPIGSTIIPVSVRTYYLRPASGGAAAATREVRGGAGPDSPVADHVVGLRVDYYGRARATAHAASAVGCRRSVDHIRPATPVSDATMTPSIAGSNCLFADNGSAIAAPLLPSFGTPDSALIPLTAAQLTDGPWCPDATAPNRYDADLLRIRSITVTLRIESALDALRGPAGLLFTRGGTARTGDRYAPDLEVRTRITPANLVLGR